MNLAELVQSSGWKNFIAKLYGLGASVVIIGALFKINHWIFATEMLTIGLCTESIIFFFSAFEPLHEEVDWSLVYPELAGIPEEGGELPSHGKHHGVAQGGGGGFVGGGGGAGSAALAKFDEMLEKAEITPELFQKLGAGMKKLGDATSNMSAMGDISAASTKYMNTIKNADESLGKLADSLSVIEVGGKSYQQQLESMNKNLSALNAAYELQIKGTNSNVKESEALLKGIQGLMKDLTDSAADTKKYREQVSKLNDNLSALNNVYGNMLSAMNVK